MVDAAWPQTQLGNFEAAPFAEQNVFLRHTHVLKTDVHVAMRRVRITEDVHRAEDRNTWMRQRHEDLALLLVRLCVRAGLHHTDHDLAARVASAGNIEFLAIDDPFITFQNGAHGHVLGVG